jgi:hypothetical protein
MISVAAGKLGMVTVDGCLSIVRMEGRGSGGDITCMGAPAI